MVNTYIAAACRWVTVHLHARAHTTHTHTNTLYWVVQWSWFAQVNALCNLSCKKSREVAASLPGQFLSRRCFTLCITMKAEPRIAKQCSTNASTVAVAIITGERGWRVGKKCLCIVFWLTRRSRVRRRKCVLGHPIARATSYCLLPDTFWLQTSKNAFKVGSVKFANSLSSPSIVKKVRTGSKSSHGT